jgi:hypothetical protein
MSKNSIIVLIHHHHELLDLIKIVFIAPKPDKWLQLSVKRKQRSLFL